MSTSSSSSSPTFSNTNPTNTTSTVPHDAHFHKLVQQERVIQSAALPLDQMPSCMDFFDKWAVCFALGPQIRYVYRYGTLDDCTRKLDDFKFCLTLRGTSKEQKREAFIERKARAMARRRMPGGNTSEEVWEIRSDPIIDPQCVDEAFVNRNSQEKT